jgi:hypothetical protein
MVNITRAVGSTPRRRQNDFQLNWIDDTAAGALVAICILNLNGVAILAANVPQLFSYPMLGACLYLSLRHFRNCISTPYLLLFAAFLSYLLLGWAYYDPDTSLVSPLRHTNAYVNSVLIITAIVGYSASLNSERRSRFNRLVRNIAVLSALATLTSPLLYQIYSNLPPSYFQRMGGLFGNPNEAGIVGVLAVALVQAFPFRHKLLQYMLIAALSMCVVVTLSKAAMASLALVLALTAFWPAKLYLKIIIVIVSAIAVVLIQDLDSLILMAVGALDVDLSQQQLDRVLAVTDILGGQLDSGTTTNRTDIWLLLFEDSWARFPAGAGLGSAHFYIGGYLEGDVWQGAHNTYLMLVAEAGPLPLALLLAALALIAARLLAHATARPLVLAILLVLAIEMFSSHDALMSRYSNAALGFVLGLVTASHRDSRRPVRRLERFRHGQGQTRVRLPRQRY